MAKKQRRYRMSELAEAIPDLKGKSVSLILKGQQVFQVKILALEGEDLLAADGLRREHRFAMGLIEEVILEMQA